MWRATLLPLLCLLSLLNSLYSLIVTLQSWHSSHQVSGMAKRSHFLATWCLPTDCFLAMCIGVEAPQLGCQSCHLPRRTHLNSFEIIIWCFPVGIYYLRSPQVMSIRLQVCSREASRVQSKQGVAALC